MTVPARHLTIAWESLLVWGAILLALFALRDVFFIAFLTFLLSYLVRSAVLGIARRLSLDGTRPALERWLTLATFAVLLAVLWGAASLLGPRFVAQGRLLMTDAQRLDPRETLEHVLNRTVGAYLFRATYGDRKDPRFAAGLSQFEADERFGEGAFGAFGRLQSRVQAEFEIAYEGAAKQGLRNQLLRGGAASRRFDDWFLKVKAPELVASRRAAYLSRWQALHPSESPPADLDAQLGRLAMADVRARPAELQAAQAEWESAAVAAEWQRFQSTPVYAQAFHDWFARRAAEPEPIPYDLDTYLALSAAYAEGLEAFTGVYRARVGTSSAGAELVASDFQRTLEGDLARQWWAGSPIAASLREHLRDDPAKVAAALATRLESMMSGLIAIPAQVATALLLTILITFDMSRLREGALRLRETRLRYLYDQVVPSLVAVARLIGRSFAAQGLIAVFNTLLTFLVLRVLGLENELLLCVIVFLASFIPVLGVILSAVPITLQALLQPDGSLALALYALLGIALIHAIEATVLSPRIVGRVLHLHPVLVMAILIIGEHLAGIWGLLLAVPISVYIIHAVLLAERIPGVYEPPARSEPD